MSPELVDQAILACCQPRFLERLSVDVPEKFEAPRGLEVDFIADRIKVLVEAERLESAGNLDRWRYSEIRLTGK
jgi:hypothetical protein